MKSLRIITLILAICSCFTNCQKLPMNGDLDGMWQLMTVNGKKVERQTYISIQLHLAQLTYGDTKNEFYYCHFKHQGSTMRFFDFCYPCGHENWNQDNEKLPEADLHKIKPFVGEAAADITYHVDHLSDRRMILSNDTLKLVYRKF